MIVTNNERYSAFPSEVLAILAQKLDKETFDNFMADYNQYILDRNAELSNLGDDITVLEGKINTNQTSISNLENTKADKSDALTKDANGNYTAATMIKSNMYSFFEDPTTGIKRLDSNRIGVIVKGVTVMEINNSGDIKLPLFAGKEDEVLSFDANGVITTQGVKLKIIKELLHFHNGSTWVCLV